MISRVRGTEDFLDVTRQNALIKLLTELMHRHNYTEIQLPFLEHTELFARSLGAATDVISKEMYTFQTEGGDSLSLRPEATASTVRAFLENKIDTLPWKVFTHGPMFRHERPQKGRWRQFTQFNIEVIGTEAVAQDAQFVAMLDGFFRTQLKLENFVLRLNWLGTKADRDAYKAILLAYLEPQKTEICATCQKRLTTNTLRIFDCKNEDCQKIYVNAPKLTDALSDASKADWQTLRTTLEMLSVNFIEDPFLVRGLDYYNATVFEFVSTDLGAQNAFCGGGRYELASQLGGNPCPSLGAALGIGRILMMLEGNPHALPLPKETPLNLVLPMTEAQQPLGLFLLASLHRAGLTADILLEKPSLKSMMRKADKLGATHVLILGEDEQKAGTVVIKNMKTGTSETVKQVEAASHCSGHTI